MVSCLPLPVNIAGAEHFVMIYKSDLMAARSARPASAAASSPGRSLLGRSAKVVALLFELAGLDPAHRLSDLGVAMHAASPFAVAVIEGDVHQDHAIASRTLGGGKGGCVERQILHCEDKSFDCEDRLFIVKTNPSWSGRCRV
jgi:hypothetical protein